jgi:replicative DNA helicase
MRDQSNPFGLSDDDMLEVLGPAESAVAKRSHGYSPAPAPRSLSLVRSRAIEPAMQLPGADELVDEQIEDALDQLGEDTSLYPSFPWARLAELSGPMCPGDLVMVAARTGGGKSLFLQNLFDHLVATVGCFGLYVGLEQTPKILRIKWAAMRAGVVPKLVLAPKPEQRMTEDYIQACAAVRKELAWQKSPEVRVRAHFSAERKINARRLRTWVEWAVDHGCDHVILDHIDRVDHGDGSNAFHEMSETVRLAKELAVEHNLVMLVATQVGRPHDALEAFSPPMLHQLRGGGTKEEEADTVLGIYRPLRSDVGDKELKAVRMGLADRETVVEPNVMGVQILKHRLDGPVAGKMVRLAVERGRVVDLPERDQYATDYASQRAMGRPK